MAASLLVHVAVFAAQVGAVALFAAPWPIIHGFSIDDAWIHQVVARTFARTGTLGYAPGQFGSGATSYLWAVVLSWNYRWLHVDPVVYTDALNALLYFGCGQLLLLLAMRDGIGVGPDGGPAGLGDKLRAALAVALACVGGNFAWFAFSGMEATLVVFLSLLAIACAAPRGRITALVAGLAAGLLAVARPETMAAGPLVVGLVWARRRDRRDAAVVAGLWLVAVVVYFGVNLRGAGALVPATFGGRKWIWLGEAAALPHALVLWDFVAAWNVRLRNYTLGTSSDVALWLSFGVAVLGLRRLVQRRCFGLLAVVAWAFVHAGIYLVILPTLGHGGRYQPLVPLAYLLLVAIGSMAFADDLVALAFQLPQRKSAIPAVALAVQAGSVAPWAALVLVGVRDWSHDHAKSVAHVRSTELGMGELINELPPDARVASFDIGGIGYAARRPIFDLGGLSDPAVARQLTEGTIWKALEARHIDYVVVPEDYDPNFPGPLNFKYRLRLLDNPAVDLRLVRVLESPEWAWAPAIRATACSAPRQALYGITYRGRPGPEAPGADDRATAPEDPDGLLHLRGRALLTTALGRASAAGLRVRVSLSREKGRDAAASDAWSIRLGPWGLRAVPPSGSASSTTEAASAFLLEHVQPYLWASDVQGAALRAVQVLTVYVRRTTGWDGMPMLPLSLPPGMVTDADQVIGAQPVGALAALAIFALGFAVERTIRRLTRARVSGTNPRPLKADDPAQVPTDAFGLGAV